jgi:hypothetical protein
MSTVEDSTSDDEVKFTCSTESYLTGFAPDSKVTQLLQKAATEGGVHLEVYSEYCARLYSVMETVANAIDLDNLVLQENKESGEVRFRQHVSIGDTKWTFTVTTKKQASSVRKASNGSDIVEYNDLTVTKLSEGGVTVHSAAVISEIVTGSAELLLAIPTIVCKAIVAQAKKTALVAAKQNTAFTLETGEEAYKAMVKKEAERIAKQTTKRTVRVVAKLGTAANLTLTALFLTSVTLHLLAHTTTWQLSVLNKSAEDIYWTNELKHGDLKFGPTDQETKQLYTKIAKAEIEKGEDGWPDVISYTRLQLTYDNEGALYGVTGNLLMRFQERVVEGERQYTFAFDIPYSGANKVSISTDSLSPSEISPLCYELVDEANNIRFRYSLSAEHDRHSVPTINGGATGWNYTSGLVIENLKEPVNV